MGGDFSYLDRLDSGLIVLDAGLNIQYWNAWQKLYSRIPSGDVAGKPLDEIFLEIDSAALKRKIQVTLALNVPSYLFFADEDSFLQIPLHQLTSSPYNYRRQQVTVLPYDQKKGWVLLSLQDRCASSKKSEQDQRFDESSRQAKFDQMTGLPNRGQMLDDMLHAKQPLLTIFSIDLFNDLNKFYGFEISEWMLKEVSERLKAFFGHKVVGVYKLPSSEYAVLADGFGTVQAWALEVEEFLEYSSGNKLVHQGRDQSFPLTFTAGISYQKKGLLRHADLALKAAFDGQKSFLVYDDSMDDLEQFEDNIRWVGVIKDALAQDRIQPYFQAIVSNQTGKVEKYETLVRLIDHQGRAITPFHFLEIAKHARLYPQITRRVFAKAFEIFKDSDYEFSLNVSVDDLKDKETMSFIRSIMAENPKQSQQVVFELLESEGIENFGDVLNFINEVKSFGGKIAIDDFGTGYSNFDYLVKLNIDILKIDGSLIKNIDVDKNSLLVVETLVEFAKKFNMKTVAEFVDSNSVLNKVKQLGITYSQGFFLAEPEPEIQQSGHEGLQYAHLDQEQLDGFGELISVSFKGLSPMIDDIIGSVVSFGTPKIDFIDANKLSHLINLRHMGEKSFKLGTQSFVGDIEGETLILLEPESMTNIATLLGDTNSGTINDDSQEGIMLEFLSILSTVCAKGMTQILGLDIKLLAPKLEAKLQDHSNVDPKAKLLVVETSIQFKKEQVFGNVLLVARMDSALLSTLNLFLAQDK